MKRWQACSSPTRSRSTCCGDWGREVGTRVGPEPGLGELAAGLVDGRQLDELTVFVLGEARVALAALSAP
jgi:hypothetical protein